MILEKRLEALLPFAKSEDPKVRDLVRRATDVLRLGQALMTEHGCQRLSDLPEDAHAQYLALMAEQLPTIARRYFGPTN
jgi:hypothetical protein